MLRYKYCTYPHNLQLVIFIPNLSSSQLVYPIANTMMFMRAILAISLVAFALAVPVAQPQADSLGEDVGVFCFSQYALYRSD